MQVAPPLAQTTRYPHFSCPECQGALEQIHEETTGTVTYLCRIGHRYGPRELLVGKEIGIEQRLWVALTALDELIAILLELEECGDPAARPSAFHARSQTAVGMRAALEALIASNEPVLLDEDMPMEMDPNARMRRKGG